MAPNELDTLYIVRGENYPHNGETWEWIDTLDSVVASLERMRTTGIVDPRKTASSILSAAESGRAAVFIRGNCVYSISRA